MNATQAEFQQTNTGSTQNAKVLAELKAMANQWVPMPHWYYMSGSMAIHSRINDLRQEGHIIEHKSTRSGRTVHSFYKLVIA